MAADTKRSKVVIALSVGAIVLIVAVLSLRRKPPIVIVADVTRQDLSANISSNGKVEPVSPFVAHAEFPTFVEKVFATEGQPVHRGQLILTLDSAAVRSQLAQARVDLLAARTDLQNAKAGGPPDQVAQLKGDLAAAKIEVANLERTVKVLQDLVAHQAATQDELAQNQASLEKARANLAALEAKKKNMAQAASTAVESAGLRVTQAQSQVESLKEKVRSATVVSPVEGVLYSLPVRAGDYVKVGDTLAEMADLHKVRVRAFVDEPDLGALRVGEKAEITWDARPGQIWSGEVQSVPEQVVERGVRSVGEVVTSVDNAKLDLLPNTNVQVRILVRRRHDTLTVPRESVRDEDDKRYVYVLVGDTLHKREVSVGVASASKYEVLSGLSEGERVAIPGDRPLRDAMQVRPVNEE